MYYQKKKSLGKFFKIKLSYSFLNQKNFPNNHINYAWMHNWKHFQIKSSQWFEHLLKKSDIGLLIKMFIMKRENLKFKKFKISLAEFDLGLIRFWCSFDWMTHDKFFKIQFSIFFSSFKLTARKMRFKSEGQEDVYVIWW